MKATITFPLLFAFLIIACSDDEKGQGGNHNSPSYSSSSKVYLKVDTLPLGQSGQSYKTMKIDSQTWLAQNLNEKPSSGGKWWCYKDLVASGDWEVLCDEYGTYYDWETAKTICPSGWHLPSVKEWEKLNDFLKEYPENILVGAAWWNATYAGYRHENGSWEYTKSGKEGDWWTSDGTNLKDRAYSYSTLYGQKEFSKSDVEKARGLSVRCVKNN